MIRLMTAWLLSLILTGAAAADNQDPEALVRQTSDRMLSVLSEEHDVIKADPKRLYGLVDDIVLPHFDFQRMARWVLGKYWRQANSEQQQAFVAQFRTLLVRTYGTALLEYSDQKVNFLPVRMNAGDKDVTIRTEISKPGGGPPIPISYSMILEDSGWKVYDVTIDGISLVSNYRTTFSSEIQTTGIDGLIQRLTQRNNQDGS